MARIAAKNHRNGVANPYAQMRRDFGFEFCNLVSEKNPYVAAPLRRTDCSLISDGAAALVVADEETAERLQRAIAFRARQHVNDFLPLVAARPDRFRRRARMAWDKARAEAGVTLDDLDFVETHDCFTIAELIEYEAMGLAAPGEGYRVVREGIAEKGGELPINPSGGLKSKGHPIGATGVSHARHGLPAAHERSGRHADPRRRSSPASSTWAAPRSPTTSRSWSDANDRAFERLRRAASRPSRSGS